MAAYSRLRAYSISASNKFILKHVKYSKFKEVINDPLMHLRLFLFYFIFIFLRREGAGRL